MKAGQLISMMHTIDYKIQHFDLHTMIKKIENKEISQDQINKLKDDVYNLEEDLVIMDCES